MPVKNRIMLIFLFIVTVAVSAALFFAQPQHQYKGHASGSGIPHVVGNQIVDGNGSPLTLRGAIITKMFNYAKVDKTTTNAYPTTVGVMANQWSMNILRLATCNWLWQADPTNYMNKLQTAVQQANQAGLYVMIDNHDDHNCNPPYDPNDPYHLPRPGMDTYMQALATAFLNNSMVMFDVYNEPTIVGRAREKYTNADWQLWLNGGTVNNETFIGTQTLVNAIRNTGAQQIIMVEGYASAATFHNIGTNYVTDPLNNIVYQAHNFAMDHTTAQWDTDFGFLSKTYPVFIGAWALIASDNGGSMNCSNIPQAQADQTVTNFLNYMANHNMGWTAYTFNIGHMILDYTNFTPMTFNVPPSTYCVDTGQGGMGVDVQQYLVASATTPSPTPSPTFTPTNTPTPTPTPDTIPPTASITSPANGSTVYVNTTVTITASASDNVGVTKVEFYVNGSLLCTDTSSPYICTWSVPGVVNARYVLQAKAYDAAGNTASSAIQVTASS